MSTKVTYSRFIELIGFDRKRKIIRSIPDTICFRKGMRRRETKKIINRYKNAFGIVSCHNVHRKANSKYCKFWCNCYKDPELYFGSKPSVLLSESDFVDSIFIQVYERKLKKYDFYYFTSGGKAGVEYKGMDFFLSSLPVLCGEFGLNGIVIKYQKQQKPFDRETRTILKRYKKNIRIKEGRQTPQYVAKIMSKCKFGFFPNKLDCSPLLMAESLVRNCPILVNESISGGWKYVNEETGSFCNLFDLPEKVEFILNKKFSPGNYWKENYGYKKTSQKLCEFGKKYIEQFKKFQFVGFQGTHDKMMRSIKC